jgi:hypothetical protein
MTKITTTILCGVLFVSAVLYAEPPSRDQTCLANAIFREAGGEPLLGQYAVGEVIMNRLNTLPKATVCSIVNDHVGNHWQFGFHKFSQHQVNFKTQSKFFSLAATILKRSDPIRLPRNILYFNNFRFRSRKYHFYCKIGRMQFFSKT